MIQDSIKNLNKYQASFPFLTTISEFILQHDLNQLVTGKTIIDSDNLFVVSIQMTTSFPPKIFKLESHRIYADLHLLLDKDENIFWSNTDLKPLEPYKPEIDTEFFKCKNPSMVALKPNYFALFLPG